MVQKFSECFFAKIRIILGKQNELVPRFIDRLARHAGLRARVRGEQLKPHAQALNNQADLLARERGIRLT